MGRFDEYLKGFYETEDKKRNKRKKNRDANVEISGDIWEFLKNESPLVKYSIIFGNIFFVLPFIKKLSILITRKFFKKYKNYKSSDPEFEEMFSKAYLGIAYFFLLLFLLFLKSILNAFVVLILLVTVSYFNIATLKKYLLEENIAKNVEITSDEILDFITWMVLLLETGMSINLALNYYVKNSEGNLSRVISIELNKVDAGEISIDVALSNLSINLQRQDLKEIFTLILQSKKLGVSIKESLMNYLEQYHERLLSVAEKKGASANQKATFMLTAEVFLIMIIFLIGMISTLLTSGIF